jgi:DNA-directed RNA polymerase omega subunit
MKKGLSRGTEIDTEQCVKNAGGNRFNLVLIAAARSREIARRHKESGQTHNVYPSVSALLEIQEGKVGAEYLKKVR